ncbi:hypothetical protein H4J42_15205, partial [Colwellia sp. BRX8-8]|nr:hypothetical protein [Colwellia sp. BRX8-8]
EPVSLNFQEPDRASQKQAFIDQQRRFHALLSDHQQQIKLGSLTVDTTNTDNESETTSIDNKKANKSN